MANHLPPERIQRVLETVFDVVAEHGYEALRMDQVARTARVSTATLYRHWGSKSALVMGVLTTTNRPGDDAPIDTGSLLGDLHASIDHVADVLPRGIQFLLSVTLAAREDEELARSYREHGVPVVTRFVDQAVARAVERGEIDAAVPATRFLTALMLTPWVVSDVLLAQPVGADDAHAFVDAVVAPLFRLNPPERS